MEICEQKQAFVFDEEEDDLVFHHTKIILRQGDQYFYATTNQRIRASSDIDINKVDIKPILTDHISQVVDDPAKFTQAPDPLPNDCYLKQPCLIHYDEDTEASRHPGDLVLHEAEICEILIKNSHPNIVQYLGCILEKDRDNISRIKGLCFVKYLKSLEQRLREEKDETPLDRQRCLAGIENGMKHLHGLGLVHNDLNPSNVMMDAQDNLVIIDFDSCQPEFGKLGLKGGLRDGRWAAIQPSAKTICTVYQRSGSG
ncbi:hypothetical protein CFIMG_007793RA00001 [Ceratocystis fimbriata CBS 114723]|uniref:Protein kinase domain-containing protein n=1 Tax=Ceratocystis fimbriata CBS 114723 TaxID=1035309 RepID=A0A2C5WUS1_9PEZI|nr:hypothetical protein CFIMG_007793RA00001 [Ceratocystis fimbriata CBS 114723]